MENLEGFSEEKKKFEKDIKKEIDKIDYYLGYLKKLIESGDFKEMVVVLWNIGFIVIILYFKFGMCLYIKRSMEMEER